MSDRYRLFVRENVRRGRKCPAEKPVEHEIGGPPMGGKSGIESGWNIDISTGRTKRSVSPPAPARRKPQLQQRRMPLSAWPACVTSGPFGRAIMPCQFGLTDPASASANSCVKTRAPSTLRCVNPAKYLSGSAIGIGRMLLRSIPSRSASSPARASRDGALDGPVQRCGIGVMPSISRFAPASCSAFARTGNLPPIESDKWY